MQPLRLLAPLLLVAPLALAATPAPAPPAVATLVASNNAFACELYAQLKSAPGNLFFSPYSISSALAMTYAGARSNTATQMAQALRFPLPQDQLHPAFADLATRLNAVQAAGHVKLSIANSLWPQQGYPLLPEYLALAQKQYGVTITPVDFVKGEPAARGQINRWVEERTQNCIQNLFAAPLAPDTRMLLVNAIYFKGKWATPFEPSRTRPDSFHLSKNTQVQAPFLKNTASYELADRKTVAILNLPYENNALSMLVVLPKEGTTLASVEKYLTPEHLRLWREQMHRDEVMVILPKFRLTWGACTLKPALTTLGMPIAFSAGHADFNGMAEQKGFLFVSDVLHKAYVSVDEEGTEAAGATAMVTESFGGAPKLFRADHPFLFLIQENATGSILFLGRVTDPTKAE